MTPWVRGLLAGVLLLPVSGHAAAPAFWRPAATATLHIQFTGLPLDPRAAADVYDLDLWDTSAATVRQLRARGSRAVCYFSAGTVEDWRPDAPSFPRQVVGRPYVGWPGERWLDLLAPLMRARLDRCRALGFDGVDPDNLDGYGTITGYALTRGDALRYARWLAREAHARGLSIGLKNVPELAAELEPHFDWAITEDCAAQGWCAELRPFARSGKPIWMLEYVGAGVTLAGVCREARKHGFFAVLKRRALDGWSRGCS